MEDFEIMDGQCPKCGHGEVHTRDCTNFCDDGMLDKSDFDAINFVPGEELYHCPECKGNGVLIWCPKCGADLSPEDITDYEPDADWGCDEVGEPADPNQMKLNF